MWEKVFFGNTLQDWLWSIGVILFVLLLNRVISRYVAKLLCRLLKRQWKDFDQNRFVDLVINPLAIFLVTTVSIVTLYRLNFPQQINIGIYKYSLQKIVHAIATTIQVVVFIWLLLRIIDFIADVLHRRADATPDQSDNQLVLFFKDFFKVIIGIVGVLMVLHFAFNYNIGSLLTGLSIVGAAIALALRESLENLIASFVIFFDKPFTTGDLVKVQNITGNVERIGLRSTRIRTADKSYVTVPNKQMVDSILDNVTLRSQLRGEIQLPLHVATEAGKIESMITGVKQFIQTIPEITSHSVVFNEIRLQALMVTVEFFTPPIEHSRFVAIKQSINLHLLHSAEDLGIHLAAEGKEVMGA